MFKIIIFVSLNIFFCNFVMAQIPSSQTAGGLLKQESVQEKVKSIEERITSERKKPGFLIRKVIFEGKDLVKESILKSLAGLIVNKTYSKKELGNLKNIILDYLESKGYSNILVDISLEEIAKGNLKIKLSSSK